MTSSLLPCALATKLQVYFLFMWLRSFKLGHGQSFFFRFLYETIRSTPILVWGYFVNFDLLHPVFYSFILLFLNLLIWPLGHGIHCKSLSMAYQVSGLMSLRLIHNPGLPFVFVLTFDISFLKQCTNPSDNLNLSTGQPYMYLS
jgi:hypothetical protein